MNNFLCLFVIFLCCLCSFTGVYSEDVSPIQQKEEKKMSELILSILEHYKQKDPVGIPGAAIPDPLDVPNLSHSFAAGKMNMFNVKLYGLSKFRIIEMETNIAEMNVDTSISIDTLYVYGNYTLSTWISSPKGPFNVNMTGVHATAKASLEVARNGKLGAGDMDMDVQFQALNMDFKGLGMFQSILNSLGTVIFDQIKPYVLKEVNENMRTEVNKNVEKLNQTFPNSISPLDQLLSEVRHEIRRAGFDPYKVPDYNNSLGIFDVYMTHTWLYGLSSVHRYKDIIFEIKNKTVYIVTDVGTQRIKGTSNWEVALVSGIMSRAGSVAFTVEHVRVHINVSQTMDTRNHPILEDIQIELGNIQIRFDGAGTMDYVIEFAVNVLPNILRFQIMDAIETPIKLRVQEALDNVNVEKIVKQNAKMIDGGKKPF